MRGTIALRRLADIVNGGTPTSDEENWNGHVAWATPVDLSKVDGGVVQTTERSLTGRGAVTGSATVPAGSVLLSTRAPIGYAATTITQCAFNQGCKGLVPRSGVDARFLRYFLSGSRMDLQALGSGSTFMELNYEALASVRVPQVEFAEQQRIADFLDDQVARIDNIIAARRAQIGMMHHWCTGRLIETMFAPGTHRVSLATIASVRLGRQRSPKSERGEHMTRYLRSANVSDGSIDLTDVKEMNFEPAEQAVFALLPGDVLITEGAGSPDSVGASAVWDGHEAGMCFQNTLLRARPLTEDVLNEYLGWWARAAHRSGAMKNWAAGANILHLGSDGLKRMAIPLRNSVDQRRVVLMCREIEESVVTARSLATSSVAALEEMKRSLITAAVSGEFDVSSADGSRVGV